MSPAGDGGAFLFAERGSCEHALPSLSGHNEIGIPSTAFRTSQQPRPIDSGHHRVRSMIAALAPYDQPRMGRGRSDRYSDRVGR
jgi:hypothetical protein